MSGPQWLDIVPRGRFYDVSRDIVWKMMHSVALCASLAIYCTAKVQMGNDLCRTQVKTLQNELCRLTFHADK